MPKSKSAELKARDVSGQSISPEMAAFIDELQRLELGFTLTSATRGHKHASEHGTGHAIDLGCKGHDNHSFYKYIFGEDFDPEEKVNGEYVRPDLTPEAVALFKKHNIRLIDERLSSGGMHYHLETVNEADPDAIVKPIGHNTGFYTGPSQGNADKDMYFYGYPQHTYTKNEYNQSEDYQNNIKGGADVDISTMIQGQGDTTEGEHPFVWKSQFIRKPYKELTEKEIEDLTDEDKDWYMENDPIEGTSVFDGKETIEAIPKEKALKPFGELTDEEINNLTPEQKEAYGLKGDVKIVPEAEEVVVTEPEVIEEEVIAQEKTTTLEEEAVAEGETVTEGEAPDWGGRIYDNKQKKWYYAEVDWNEDTTDYELTITDYETNKVLSEDDKIYKSINETVIHNGVGGKRKYKASTDDQGNTTYTLDQESGSRYQLADKPIASNKKYDYDSQTEKKGTAGDLPSYVTSEEKAENNKMLLDDVSGRAPYLKFLENEKENTKIKKGLRNEIDILNKNLSGFREGSDSYNKALKKIKEKEAKLQKMQTDFQRKENVYKKDLLKKEIDNYVAATKETERRIKEKEQELLSYTNSGEEAPAELKNEIAALVKQKEAEENRVNKLVEVSKSGHENYIISPIQQGYNTNVLNQDGSINTEKSKASPILTNILEDGTKDDVVNIVGDGMDMDQTIGFEKENPIIGTPKVKDAEEGRYYKNEEAGITYIFKDGKYVDVAPAPIAETITEEEAEDPQQGVMVDQPQPLIDPKTIDPSARSSFQNALSGVGNMGESLLKGAGAALDAIGGPGAIISYIMGKKGLDAAMKEIEPLASPQLSPMFMEHLRQTKELAKKGFHPDQEREFRKELDNAYQIGLENAVRGSGGQRARFLAQSGVLDAQRSSALLEFAAKDEELQGKNADKYEKMMLFKENFDLNRTAQEKADDMARQVADKKAAAGFTSAAFTNLMSNMGGGSSIGALVDQFMKKSNQRDNQFVSDVPEPDNSTAEENTIAEEYQGIPYNYFPEEEE